jgi:hypothetical protein
MHGSRSKIPSKKSRPYIYDVKFLALLGASYIYDISRLRVKVKTQREAHLAKCIAGKTFTALINDKRARKVLHHAISIRDSHKADETSHLG